MSPRFADIAVNLTDSMFTGNYRGKQLHRSDFEEVIARARGKGVEKMIITGTSLKESRDAVEMGRQYGLHATIGCHPTSTSEIANHKGGVEGYMKELDELLRVEVEAGKAGKGRVVVAVGEIGLDYDRLHHSPTSTQLSHLPALLHLAETHNLPLFLHSRHPDAHKDLVRIFREAGWRKVGEDQPKVKVEDTRSEGGGSRGRMGVVHSFTGSKEEAEEMMEYGLYIGINGCSLKTEENLEVLKSIPLNRIMLETDAPWCTITSTAASHKHLAPKGHPLEGIEKTKVFKEDEKLGVKGRNEPGDIVSVAYVVAQVKGVSVEELAEAAWKNTMDVFFPEECA